MQYPSENGRMRANERAHPYSIWKGAMNDVIVHFFCSLFLLPHTTKRSTLSYSFVCCVSLFKGNSILIYTQCSIRDELSFYSISFHMFVYKKFYRTYLCVFVCTSFLYIPLYINEHVFGEWIYEHLCLCINWYI